MITDKLRSYGAARRQVMPNVEHRSHRGLNNRAENSHVPLRKRERMMQGFRSAGGLQRFTSVFSAVRRTGKGGSYRYYHCSSATRGKKVCTGPSIPEKQLDDAVLTAVRSRVLDKDHLTNLIFGLQRRERARSDSAIEELPSLQSQSRQQRQAWKDCGRAFGWRHHCSKIRFFRRICGALQTNWS
jgi:hypothetical protein